MSVIPCAPVVVTRGIVVFDAAAFKTQYPQFATIDDAVLQVDFDIATLFLNNSCCSVVKDANIRERLLNMLVAHIAALLQGENGKPPAGIVGRVDKASEGTVSVSASYVNDMSMSEAYFAQTPYGVMFWTATAGFRAFHYVPAPVNGCVGRGPGFFGPGSFNGGGCC
jgi:hypothetical protein